MLLLRTHRKCCVLKLETPLGQFACALEFYTIFLQQIKDFKDIN